MSPKNLAEDCIFCGMSPCECEGPKLKPKKAKPKTIKPKTDSPSKPNPIEIMASEPPRLKVTVPEVPPRDLSLESALTHLRDIVTPFYQRKIDTILKVPYPQEVDKRVSEWRNRHGKDESPPAQPDS